MSSAASRWPRASAAVVVAASLLAMTACAAEPAGGDDEVTADTKATITYAIWDETQKPGIEANIASFNELYPGITVNVAVTPWEEYWTKLQTQASSDTLPDLFWLNGSYLLTYAAAGKLAPITSLVEDGAVDLDQYPAALTSSFAYDGVQYGVPKDFDTFAVWYNPALFGEAGVAEPAGEWDWHTFTSTAAALQDKFQGDGRYALVAEMAGFNALYSSIWQAGGQILSEDGSQSRIDSPQTQRAIEFWQNLERIGALPSPQQLSDTSALDWFGSGKAAMFISGSYDRTAIANSSLGDAVQVAPLPHDVKSATITGGLAPVASAKGKNLAATRAFQAYLASEQAQQEQGDLGSVIPAHAGTQQGWVDTMPGTKLSVFIDAVDYAHSDPINPNANEWGVVVDELFVKAMTGELTAAEASAQMGAAIDEAMDNQR